MASILDSILEKNLAPDMVVRFGIRYLLSRKLAFESSQMATRYGNDIATRTKDFADELRSMPIAICTNEANEQHYEVPAHFYDLVLGAHKKYSSALWLKPSDTLDDAERNMLELYCQRAELEDGQTVLDCGCGWGSVSLYLAEKYPNSQITGLSNSHSQREWIMNEAQRRGLNNLTIVTGNIVTYEFSPRQFNRVLSIEMFEHMKNYDALLNKIASWMTEDSQLFVHIFTHRQYPYHYQDNDGTDWLARYFFTGGTMPNHDLLYEFNRDLTVVNDWVVDGTHYEKTANAWLARMDANRPSIMPILEDTYGEEDALKWLAYWRIFFMACAELWGFSNGREWQVSHYLLRPTCVA